MNEDFDIQFAVDYMDDQSGVRSSKMLAPNPLAPQSPPMRSRYDIRSGMQNVNDTEMKGASATANWRANDDWSFKYILARHESDTLIDIDFDSTPLPLFDIRTYYNDR